MPHIDSADDVGVDTNVPFDGRQLKDEDVRNFPFLASTEQIARAYSTDSANGLSKEQLKMRGNDLGNVFPQPDKEPILSRLVDQASDPMICLLLASACVSLFMGQLLDAGSILAAVMMVVIVGVVMESSSDDKLASLRNKKQRVCIVVRDGKAMQIKSEQLVLGDLVRLQAGDQVCAELRLVSASELHVNEQLLTGEQDATKKHTSPLQPGDVVDQELRAGRPGAWREELGDMTKLSHRKMTNMVLMNSSVLEGRATGIVVRVGTDTFYGSILVGAQEKPPAAPIQKRMDHLASMLSAISLGVIAVLTVAGILLGHPIRDMFNIAVSLAVAAIPEGLPVCVLVTLVLSVERLASKGVITRKLRTIETLGNASMIFLDKTGTLTSTHMTVLRTWVPRGSAGVLLDVRAHADPGPSSGAAAGGGLPVVRLTSPSLAPEVLAAYEVALGWAASMCHESRGSRGAEHGAVVLQAPNDTDRAVAMLACGLQQRLPDLLDTEANLIQYTHLRGFMARHVVLDNSEVAHLSCLSPGGADTLLRDGKDMWIVKGDPDWILDNLHATADVLEAARATQQQLSDARMRVLAVAACKQSPPVFRTSCPGKFVLLGLLGIASPVNASGARTVHKCFQAGVGLCIVTGDSEGTAVAVARELELYDPSQDHLCVRGSQIAQLVQLVEGKPCAPSSPSTAPLAPRPAMASLASGLSAKGMHSSPSMSSVGSAPSAPSALSNTGLLERITRDPQCVRVVYRAEPVHKLRIIQLYQALGHVVGMAGDGVNDALALRKADLGLAPAGATDVAKEAADLVLTHNSLEVLYEAVLEGKLIFFQVLNFLRFQLTTSIAAMLLMLFALLLNVPMPLNTIQILFINIVMDGPPAQGLGMEPPPAHLKRYPAQAIPKVLPYARLLLMTGSTAVVMVLGTFAVFLFGHGGTVGLQGALSLQGAGGAPDLGFSDDTHRSAMAFLTFVFFQLFHAFNCRSLDEHFWFRPFQNKMLLISVGVCTLPLLAYVCVSNLFPSMLTEPVSLWDCAIAISVASTVLMAETVRKACGILTTLPHDDRSVHTTKSATKDAAPKARLVATQSPPTTPATASQGIRRRGMAKGAVKGA